MTTENTEVQDESVEEPVNEEVEETEESIDPDDFEAVKKALKKANHEAAKYRHELKELREQTESEQEKALRQAREEAANEAKQEYVQLVARAEAKAKLREAGVTGNIDRLIKLIEFDELEVNEDGGVDGLDDQINGLKEDYKELFDKTRSAPKVDAGDKAPPSAPKSSAEKIAAYYNG